MKKAILAPRALKSALPALFLACLGPELASENVTLTTYYPAPSGIYTQMITTGNTFLARDGGNVGVGTAAPRAKMEVNGLFRVGVFADDAAAAAAAGGAPGEGTLYFNSTAHAFRGFQNGAFASLAGPSSSQWVVYSAPIGGRKDPEAVCQGAGFAHASGACKAMGPRWGGGIFTTQGSLTTEGNPPTQVGCMINDQQTGAGFQYLPAWQMTQILCVQ